MFFPFVFALVVAGSYASAVPTGDSSRTVNKVKLLQLINDVRKKGCTCGDSFYNAAPALGWNDQLEKAAFNHSSDMSSKNYFSHDSPSGTTPGDRIKTSGYTWTAYAENIGFGYSTEETMVKGWLKSPGHCRNIMGKNFREIGVAKVNDYWTADFASR